MLKKNKIIACINENIARKLPNEFKKQEPKELKKHTECT